MNDDPETEEEQGESDLQFKQRLAEEKGEHDADCERSGD